MEEDTVEVDREALERLVVNTEADTRPKYSLDERAVREAREALGWEVRE